MLPMLPYSTLQLVKSMVKQSKWFFFCTIKGRSFINIQSTLNINHVSADGSCLTSHIYICLKPHLQLQNDAVISIRGMIISIFVPGYMCYIRI